MEKGSNPWAVLGGLHRTEVSGSPCSHQQPLSVWGGREPGTRWGLADPTGNKREANTVLLVHCLLKEIDMTCKISNSEKC